MASADVIQTILRTEKGTLLEPRRKYFFAVAVGSNKIQIRQAVEQLYNVKVQRVNTCLMHGKLRRLRAQLGRRPDWKRAIVTLRDGDKIETA